MALVEMLAPPTAQSVKFSVLVDGNSAGDGESRRYLLGNFSTYADAEAACQKIVDDFLRRAGHGLKGEKLLAAYRAFGEKPVITSDTGDIPGPSYFSAWEYAQCRCAEWTED